MKKSILTRILAALGGVMLCGLALCALAETFFHVPVTGWVGQLLNARTPLAVLIVLLLAILLCALGVSGLMMLSSKRAAKKAGFVMQKGENGVIGVAVKSIEGLVQTCVRQHDTVHSAEIAVVERRDGIVILLDIKEAAGVNIPLAVGALQKQIKQYVNECTGVDVHEVRVMVENTEEPVVASPYAVKEPVVMTTAVTAAELQREATEAAETAAEAAEETAEVPAMPEIPAEDPVPEVVPVLEIPAVEELPEEEAAVAEEMPAPVIQTAPVVMPVIPDIVEEEDDRPLHQRLFGMEDEPVFVPAPPELVVEPAQAAPVEAPVLEAEAAEEAPAQVEEPEMDAFAVLEVVEAVSGEIAGEIAAVEEIIAPAEEPEETGEIGEISDEPGEENAEDDEIVRE